MPCQGGMLQSIEHWPKSVLCLLQTAVGAGLGYTGVLGNSPHSIGKRAVQKENSGKTVPWVILNWSHVPAGVSRVSIPMQKPLGELQSPAAPAQRPYRGCA